MFTSSLSEFAQQQGIPLWLLIFVVLWSLVWKGIAWWKSARLNHPVWFVAFFIINTLGILEILYIFLFSRTEFLTTFRKAVPRRKIPDFSKMQLPQLSRDEVREQRLRRWRRRR